MNRRGFLGVLLVPIAAKRLSKPLPPGLVRFGPLPDPEFIMRARQMFAQASAYEAASRKMALKDFEFLSGDQWERSRFEKWVEDPHLDPRRLPA